MSKQEALANAFTRAIEIEQKCDMLLTSTYLETYSARKLASLGLAITNLVMSNIRMGMAGKALIELTLDPAFSQPGEEIAAGVLRVGDIVSLDRMASAKDEKLALEGVVTKLSGKIVVVLVREDASDEKLLALYNNTGNDNIRMLVVKLTNSVTYKRMIQVMERLQKLDESKMGSVIRLLLGIDQFFPGKFKTLNIGVELNAGVESGPEFYDSNLNDSQRHAVTFALNNPVTIIHGPPGTGKTYTLIELIRQLKFRLGEKVLVCGASNISVDNILERLAPVFAETSLLHTKRKAKTSKKASDGLKSTKHKELKRNSAKPEKLIRVGHPARLLEANLQHSLDVLCKSSGSALGADNQAIIQDIAKDIGETMAQIKKCKRYGERRALWGELKQLKSELWKREKKTILDLLCGADVVLSTLHGAGSNELYSIYKNSKYGVENPFFDTIIIDEVSQALEPQCWIPIINHLGCRRLVIAGDNKQLPPVVESLETAQKLDRVDQRVANLGKTLFDRLVQDIGGDDYRQMLNIQYRMNAKIMEFPSRWLYDGKLKAAKGCADILLCDMPNVEKTDLTSVPCYWYDTQGGDFPEQQSEDPVGSLALFTGSKYNEMEALVVLAHVTSLLDAGVPSEDIGVISPYSAQVSVLKKVLGSFDKIEVSTIDGFQGREKEAIIISLVRSNDNREVGFLADYRRLNVAMTRSRRQLCVIGDMMLLHRSGVKFLKDWAEYVESHFEIQYPYS